jgi:hypothetical protein
VRRDGVLVGDVPAGDSHAPLGPYDTTRCASQLQAPSCSSAHTAWGSDCGDAATMTKGRMTTWRGSRPTGAGGLMQRCQVAATSRRPSSWAVADAGAPEHVRWAMACRRDGDDVLQRVAFEESSSKTSALHTARPSISSTTAPGSPWVIAANHCAALFLLVASPPLSPSPPPAPPPSLSTPPPGAPTDTSSAFEVASFQGSGDL